MKTFRTKLHGSEFKVLRLQETLGPDAGALDNPELVAAYLTPRLAKSLIYRPDVENIIVIPLTVRRRPIGFEVVSTGTLDTALCHAREIFRAAIIANAAAITVCHNHPSGDPSPSEADIRVTRDLVRAGQLLKIELVDHIILGRPAVDRTKYWCSLRELGYFAL